ncbi:MAG: methylmalonyl-CoA mutase [Dehalococcoidia bacterium]|nr:methylmalonyl-CoA mutase [Dehalococcoidia bacterium]
MPSQNKQEWNERTYDPAVKRFPERRPDFHTSSDIPLQPLYAPEDNAGLAYPDDLGYPGEFPYTRGVQPTMYRGRFWTMRQYAGFSSAEESNKRYRYLLEQGQTGLSVAFDLPTQTGYDSDHPMAEAEVGQVGVPIDSLRDMEILFDGISLSKVSTSMTINATAPVLLAFYLALAKRQGADLNKLDGTIQNDILKEYIARGTYIYPPQPSMRLITDIFQFCGTQVASWNTISISGYHMREAGCTAAQEIGFTLANAIAYVEAALAAGLDIDDFAGRLSFFFVSQNNFFEEVAKFRAARRLWAGIVRDRFHAKNPRSAMLRFHTQTAGVSLTAQQPMNNIVRTALQALAAVLGGTQSLHTNSWDEALALPSEEAVQIALRTQQLIAYESGAGDVADPMGGSYYVESLTNTLEEKARGYIDEIDRLGGAVAAIQSGYVQREVQEASYRFQMEVERGDQAIVGVNKFTAAPRPLEKLFRVDPAWVERQRARTKAVRAERDQRAAGLALRKLGTAARSSKNTMPVFVECVEAYCTIGEICDVLREAWGEMREVVVV